MKITLKLDLEVSPENELTLKQQQNATGMMVRAIRHRLEGLLSRRFGGEHSPTGWEITLDKIEVSPISKVN